MNFSMNNTLIPSFKKNENFKVIPNANDGISKTKQFTKTSNYHLKINYQRKNVITYSRLKHFAFPVEIDEEDLKQFADRSRWYEAKWCASDQPAWNTATVIDNQKLNNKYNLITLETEISREKISLKNAYKNIGQRAQIRVKNSAEIPVTVAVSPFPGLLNRQPLYNVRGDQFANEEKGEKEELSIKANLEVLINEKEFPELFKIESGDEVEVGPYTGTGLKLRGPILGIYRYSNIIIFCGGKGIASAKALIEAANDISSLNIPLRDSVRLYYKAENEENFIFKNKFENWEKIGCKVFTTTNSFQDLFDDDDSLVYIPEETAAVVLTCGDEEMEKEILNVCKEADISLIIKDTEEQEEVDFVATGDFQV